jgi:hypothetical protein
MTHDSESMARGVLAGTGAFHALGRSIAFASGSFLGAAGFTAVVRQSIGAASDLNEQMNKVRVVFKDGAQDVIEFSKTTTNSLGIAQHEALATAATFGNMLVPMGFAREGRRACRNLVKLAADMASFNNADPSEVLEALRSGLAGEVEPLRRFGVQLSDARERQVLTRGRREEPRRDADGAAEGVGGLPVDHQGHRRRAGRLRQDVWRSREPAADPARAVAADMEAQIGTALLPTVLKVTKATTDWLFIGPNGNYWIRDPSGQMHDTGIKAPLPAGTDTTGTAQKPGTNIPGKGVQLPTFITATHQTAGLAGFPAVDIMAKPGTPIRAPEDGMVTRISGHEPTEPPPQGQGGPWGLSIYYIGTQTGNTYYMTHLVKVAAVGSYKKGDVIGLIGDYPGSAADHVHFAIHKGEAAEAHVGSGLFDPADFLGAAAAPRSGGGAPKGPGARAKAPSLTAMPDDLRLRLADAHGNAQAQIRVLTEFERILEQRKRAAKKVSDKADIQEEIDNTLDRIAGLRKKKSTGTVDPSAMPEKLRLSFEEAVGKDDVDAEIQILTEFEKLLEKRKQLAKRVAAKADIQAEINQVRGQISDLAGGKGDTARQKALDAIGGISDTIAGVIGRALPSGAAGTRDIITPAVLGALGGVVTPAKTTAREFTGVSVVRFDPKSQKYITTIVKPDVDALKAEFDHITKNVLPTLDKRIKATRAAIKRLSRHPKKNKAQLAHMRQTLQALITEKGEVLSTATDLAQSINELADALKVEPDTENVPTEAQLEEKAAEDARTAEEAAKQVFDARQSYLEDIPADLRLAQAQAELTDTPADDRAALVAIRDVTQQRLAQAYADGNTQIEAQIVLVERLASLNAQLNEQRAEESQQLIAYLQARRDLTRTYADTVFSRQFGGTQIVLQNTFANVPDDPHLYSQNLAFELQAIT